MIKDKVMKNVALASLVEPKFLSLVDLPANQTAFKILRADKDPAAPVIPRIRRITKRSDSPLIELLFPAGMDEDTIKEYADAFGLSDYTVSKEGDSYVLRKDGVKRSDDNISIILQGNVKAYIARSDKTQKDAFCQLTLANFEFGKDYYVTEEEVTDWCKRNNVDITKCSIENNDTNTLVKRVDLKPEDETKKITVDDGVIASVIRSSEMDIPSQYVAVISEAAYGNWGWGQLDFSAAMADTEFCDVADEATNILVSVTKQILFYSPLSTQMRKDLIANAAQQFSEYIGSLLDALPTQMIVATRSILDKETSMTEKLAASEEAVRSEPEAVKPEQNEAPPVVAEVVATAITRAEVEKIVSAAIKAAMEAVSAKREEFAVAPAEVKEQATEEKQETAIEQVLRSVAENMKSVAENQKEIGERLKTLEGNTTVRSDDGDVKQREQKDVFSGALFRKQA